MTATKMKATGMDGFNMLLSRKYLKLEKPFMMIQQSHEKWSREAEFQGDKMMMKKKRGLGWLGRKEEEKRIERS